MAGIGDYIHYKKANYRKYGTNREGRSNYGSAMSVYAAQKNEIRKRLPSTKSNDLQGLENFLNGMMYSSDNESLATQQAINELQQRVSTVFAEKYPNFGINFQKGMHVYYKGDNKTSQQDRVHVKTLEKYLNTIRDMANGLIKVSEKKKDMAKIQSTISQLESYINTHQDEKFISLKDNKAASNLMADINTVLKMQSVPKALAIGDAFEYWLALASQYAGAKAVDMSDELIINTLVKGGNRSTPVISLSNFSDEYVSMDELLSSGAFSPDWKPIDDNTAFRFNKPTQDKLDMVFNWKGDELKVSAKNYQLANSNDMIHLVSGTSLLYLISTEKADFVNHWLNTVSGSQSESIDSKLLQAAHISMKLTILAKALTGLDTSAKANVSDTFILNNRANHHIYVRSTGEVFDSIESLVTNDVNGVRFSNYPNRIPNVWIGEKKGAMSRASAQQRISNLLATLHKYNISVSIKPDVAIK